MTQSTVVSSLSIIYRLVFVKERQCVYCEVGTDLHTRQTKLMHSRFKKKHGASLEIGLIWLKIRTSVIALMNSRDS